jgi:hypothetical protein
MDPGDIASRPIETGDKADFDRSLPDTKTIGIVTVATFAA